MVAVVAAAAAAACMIKVTWGKSRGKKEERKRERRKRGDSSGTIYGVDVSPFNAGQLMVPIRRARMLITLAN